jgi:hypothetical protein
MATIVGDLHPLVAVGGGKQPCTAWPWDLNLVPQPFLERRRHDKHAQVLREEFDLKMLQNQCPRDVAHLELATIDVLWRRHSLNPARHQHL